MQQTTNFHTFSIQLDNSSRTYYAGQYITGKIIVNSETEVPTRGIALRFSGSASVTWTESVEEGSGDSLRNVVKRHANKEVYMDEELYAFGRGKFPYRNDLSRDIYTINLELQFHKCVCCLPA